MKKFLALALALLMLIPLAANVGAAGLISTSSSSQNEVVTVDEFAKILDYWKWLNSDEDYYDYYYDYIYGGTTKSWSDYCDVCHKVAKYYIEKGNVYCSCTNCGKTYEIYVKTETEDNKNSSSIVHGRTDCERNDVSYYYLDGELLWFCENCGRYGLVDKYNWNENYDYSIKVICSYGGDYTISGGIPNADYGEVKTIKFTPDSGYALSEVVVNGKSYGYCPELTLTIKGNVTIRAYFVKVNTLKTCTFTATSTGGGTIRAVKNSQKVDASRFTAKYTDSVTYKFTPASSNYYIADVKIDGKSVGQLTSYTFNGITSDHKIEVTFAWNCPYNDVNDKYLNAVEYVTEAGIMSFFNKYVSKNAFSGTTKISVKTFAAALAEMADANDVLDTVAERIEWAEKNGIIDGNADLTVTCDVQAACDIVDAYLTVLEKTNKIDFEDFDTSNTAKENAISIGMVSSSTYKKNRDLNRYDLASVCYLIANLDY